MYEYTHTPTRTHTYKLYKSMYICLYTYLRIYTRECINIHANIQPVAFGVLFLHSQFSMDDLVL